MYKFLKGITVIRMTFLQVQLSVIALFFKYNLDEAIVARTAAGLSFRNPVERCHAIANLGLQGMGLTRERMEPQMEKLISRRNSNVEIREITEGNELFNESVTQSLQSTKQLIEEMFLNGFR